MPLMEKPKRILFVCLGNIIRSPLAENLFRHLSAERGLDHRYDVDSAGTSSWHAGERPDARMRRTAAAHGVEVSGRSRQVRREDFYDFDLILAMDPDNKADLLTMAPNPQARAKVRLLREFDPEGDPEAGVPDPYYGGPEGFERTYRIVERSVQGLLQALERGEV